MILLRLSFLLRNQCPCSDRRCSHCSYNACYSIVGSSCSCAVGQRISVKVSPARSAESDIGGIGLNDACQLSLLVDSGFGTAAKQECQQGNEFRISKALAVFSRHASWIFS